MLTELGNKTVSPQVQALKNELSAVSFLREGLVAEATLVRKLSRQAFFDLGKFGTGVVYGVEFLNAKDIIRKLAVGSRLAAKILTLDGEGGYAELSLTEANRQRVWQQVEEAQENGEIIKVKVEGVNSGGLMVNVFDLRGFLPVSQLAAEHYPTASDGDRQQTLEELKKFIGVEFSVKIINANLKKNRLIVSERETVSVNVKELLNQYRVGQTVEGIVSGVADFGVFVRFADNPQIEGLVHISEIAHRMIDNPKEAVTMNEAVKVKILDIREGRVFLSLKALAADPWEGAEERYRVGQEVFGKVYKLNPLGVLVNLADGVQGVIHVAEFGGAEEMKAIMLPDSKHGFIVEAVRGEEKRLVLKLKK